MGVEIPTVGEPKKILVVEDDPLLADLVSEWVTEKWDCETVNSGASALEKVNEGFEVVLLDRQMPGMSGEEVLEVIRGQNVPVQVLMVSGVEPDLDIVELSIDDYLQKPVDRPTLQGKIEELLLRRTYHPIVEEFFVCAAKLDVLEATKSGMELAGSERYIALKARADELRQAADATLGRMSLYVSEFHDVEADD